MPPVRRNPRRSCTKQSLRPSIDTPTSEDDVTPNVNDNVDDDYNFEDEIERADKKTTSKRRTKKTVAVASSIADDDDDFDDKDDDDDADDDDFEEEILVDDEEEMNDDVIEKNFVSAREIRRTTVKEKAKKRRPKRSKVTNANSDKVDEEGLTEAQKTSLDELFQMFDKGTGRIGVADVRRVADDNGIDLTIEEATDMIRFWASSTGSSTIHIERSALTKIALESKFIKN